MQSCLEEMSLLFFSICCCSVFCYLKQKKKKAGRGRGMKVEELLSADEHIS